MGRQAGVGVTGRRAGPHHAVPAAHRPEQPSDPFGGPARPAEDLAVGDPRGTPTVGGRLEVAVEVGVAPAGRVVAEPTVQLHDETAVVLDVLERRSTPRPHHPDLTPADRQPVRPLDPGQVAVLEHRAGPDDDIGEHVLQERSTAEPTARPGRHEQPLGRRAPALHRTGELVDDTELVEGLRRRGRSWRPRRATGPESPRRPARPTRVDGVRPRRRGPDGRTM